MVKKIFFIFLLILNTGIILFEVLVKQISSKSTSLSFPARKESNPIKEFA